MANEITVTACLTVYKPADMIAAIGRALTRQFTMTGNNFIASNVSLATSATLIPLGSVTSPHWAYFLNTDPNNYLTIQNGASGAVFPRLLAGEGAFVPLDPNCVPYGTANTAAVLLEYLIIAL